MSYINEYISKKLSIDQMNSLLKDLLSRYNTITGSFIFVYAAAMNKQIPDLSLSMDDYYIISDILKDINADLLHFYIETPGGQGVAAEEIAGFTRQHFKRVEFLVAGEAKSAGTILALSGDDIIMTPTGSLGPIDAQVKVGRGVVSAYDYIDWVDNKIKQAQSDGKLNPFDATIIAQISPGEINGILHSLKFAEDLVVEWLYKYKFKDWCVTENRKIQVTDEMKKDRAREIAQELCNHGKWRTHGRSLKSDDLKEIGLIVRDFNGELLEIVSRIKAVIWLIFNTSSTYKLLATNDTIMSKQAVSSGPIPQGSSFQQADVAEFEVKCPNCEKVHKIYAKLRDDPNIDIDMKSKKSKPFPPNDILICECNSEITLTGVKNEIENSTKRKIVI